MSVVATTSFTAPSAITSPAILDMGDGTRFFLRFANNPDPIIYKSTDKGATWASHYTFTGLGGHSIRQSHGMVKYQDGATTRVFTAYILGSGQMRFSSFTYSAGSLSFVSGLTGGSGNLWVGCGIAATPDPDVTNGEILHVLVSTGTPTWMRVPVAADGTLSTESTTALTLGGIVDTSAVHLEWDHNGDGFTPARTNAVDMRAVWTNWTSNTMYVNSQRLYHTGTGGWQAGTNRQWSPGGFSQSTAHLGEVGVDCDGTNVWAVVAGLTTSANNHYVGKVALSSDADFTQVAGPLDGKFSSTRRFHIVRYRSDIDALDVETLFPTGQYSWQLRDLAGTPTLVKWPISQASFDLGHDTDGFDSSLTHRRNFQRAYTSQRFNGNVSLKFLDYPITGMLTKVPDIGYGWVTVDQSSNGASSTQTVGHSTNIATGTMLFHFVGAVNALSATPFSISSGATTTKLLDEKTGGSEYPRLSTWWRWYNASSSSTTYTDGEGSGWKMGSGIWVRTLDQLETPDPTFVTVSESRTNAQNPRIPQITVPSAGLIVGAIILDNTSSPWTAKNDNLPDWHLQNVTLSLLLLARFVTQGGTYGPHDVASGFGEYSASNLVFIPISVLAGINNWGWVPIG